MGESAENLSMPVKEMLVTYESEALETFSGVDLLETITNAGVQTRVGLQRNKNTRVSHEAIISV